MPVSSVPAKPLPISKPFDAGSDITRARQIGLELVEHRLAEAGRHVAADALDDAAERVAGAPRLVDARDHRRRGARRRGSARCSPRPSASVTRRRVDRRPRWCARLLHVGEHLDAARATASSLRAMAPAATRPMVSRAEARPPPCQLRMPYLAS